MHYSELPTSAGIYRATTPTGETYIGQAIDIRRRAADHNTCIKTGAKLTNAIDTHGKDNIDWEVVELVDGSTNVLREREAMYLTIEKGLGCAQLNTRNQQAFLLSPDGINWTAMTSYTQARDLLLQHTDYDAEKMTTRMCDNIRRGGVRMIGPWYMMPLPTVDVSNVSSLANVPTAVEVCFEGVWKTFDSYTQASEYYGANIRRGYAPKRFEVREA